MHQEDTDTNPLIVQIPDIRVEAGKEGAKRFNKQKLPALQQFIDRWLDFEDYDPEPTLKTSLAEIKKQAPTILKFMGNGKSPGKDQFQIESVKLASDDAQELYIHLICKCMVKAVIPEQYRILPVALLYKPGNNPDILKERRPIGLGSRSRVFLEKLLDKLLVKQLYNKLEQSQFAGNKGSQCADAQMVVIAAQEIMKTHPGINGYIMYIDFADAYTTIDFSRLWVVLRKYGLAEDTIKLIKKLHEVEMEYILWHGNSERFKQLRGLIQGSGIAPRLFNLFVDLLAYKIRQAVTGTVLTEDYNVSQVDWVDDKCLLICYACELQIVNKILEDWNTDTGMLMKVKEMKKTVIMTVDKKLPEQNIKQRDYNSKKKLQAKIPIPTLTNAHKQGIYKHLGHPSVPGKEYNKQVEFIKTAVANSLKAVASFRISEIYIHTIHNAILGGIANAHPMLHLTLEECDEIERIRRSDYRRRFGELTSSHKALFYSSRNNTHFFASHSASRITYLLKVFHLPRSHPTFQAFLSLYHGHCRVSPQSGFLLEKYNRFPMMEDLTIKRKGTMPTFFESITSLMQLLDLRYEIGEPLSETMDFLHQSALNEDWVLPSLNSIQPHDRSLLDQKVDTNIFIDELKKNIPVPDSYEHRPLASPMVKNLEQTNLTVTADNLTHDISEKLAKEGQAKANITNKYLRKLDYSVRNKGITTIIHTDGSVCTITDKITGEVTKHLGSATFLAHTSPYNQAAYILNTPDWTSYAAELIPIYLATEAHTDGVTLICSDCLSAIQAVIYYPNNTLSGRVKKCFAWLIDAIWVNIKKAQTDKEQILFLKVPSHNSIAPSLMVDALAEVAASPTIPTATIDPQTQIPLTATAACLRYAGNRMHRPAYKYIVKIATEQSVKFLTKPHHTQRWLPADSQGYNRKHTPVSKTVTCRAGKLVTGQDGNSARFAEEILTSRIKFPCRHNEAGNKFPKCPLCEKECKIDSMHWIFQCKTNELNRKIMYINIQALPQQAREDYDLVLQLLEHPDKVDHSTYQLRALELLITGPHNDSPLYDTHSCTYSPGLIKKLKIMHITHIHIRLRKQYKKDSPAFHKMYEKEKQRVLAALNNIADLQLEIPSDLESDDEEQE